MSTVLQRKMKTTVVLSACGTGMLVAAIILHIVCLATPYYVVASSDGLKEKVNKWMDRQHLTENQKMKLMELGSFDDVDININYGLWKICLSGPSAGKRKLCAKWASETKVGSDGPDSYAMGGWMKGSQAMAIVGLLIAAAAAVQGIINILVPSRGDRLRLLPIFICVTGVAGGILVLVGDIILAFNYDTIMKYIIPAGIPAGLVKIIESQFFLSWGFALDVVAATLMLAGSIAHLGSKGVDKSSDEVFMVKCDPV